MATNEPTTRNLADLYQLPAIDWDDVRSRTQSSTWARAFFVMLEGLGILAEASPSTGGHETRVRVLNAPRGSAAANVG